jgi:hypothetical protein
MVAIADHSVPPSGIPNAGMYSFIAGYIASEIIPGNSGGATGEPDPWK